MYLFYVDETGNLDVSLSTSDGRKKDHIFCLTACGLFDGKWKNFYMDLIGFKKRKIAKLSQNGIKLNLEECEVKSTHLRIPKERKTNKFLRHLSDSEIKEISALYFASLEKYNMVLCSVVIDKRYLEPHFDRIKLHRKAWELLCERIVNYMTEYHPKHKVILIKDDISRQENADLARKHSVLFSKGTTASISLHSIVEMPLFTRSELSEGIQLADLCSYNIYNAFRYENFEYDYFINLLPFFCVSKRTRRDKIDGLKVFPPSSPLLDSAKKISLCR